MARASNHRILGTLRQEKYHEFKACLGYIISLRLAWLQKKRLVQNGEGEPREMARQLRVLAVPAEDLDSVPGDLTTFGLCGYQAHTQFPIISVKW